MDELSASPKVPWTSSELKPLTQNTLREILTRDLGVEPAMGTDQVLRKQILVEQQLQKHRGTLRWIEWSGVVLLYEASAARSGRRTVEALAAITSWADLRRLVRQRFPAAGLALEHLWDLWDDGLGAEDDAFGLSDDSEAIEGIASVEDLIRVISPDTPLELENDTGEGFAFVDPFSPYQMGVPILIIERYCVECDDLSSGTAIPSNQLPSVKQTLGALGWTLRKGRREDLMIA